MITLRGMTWNHPRGFDPLVAASQLFADRHPDVCLTWEKRSLQDFEHFPVEVLAETYDLIVIDHPHIGGLADAGVLLPFDGQNDTALADLARNSVGPSFGSYRWSNRQWALPIDAAAQVQAWRPDVLSRPFHYWADVLALAKDGRVLWPLRAPHQLMSFMTLAANLGTPCNTEAGDLLESDHAVVALERLRELSLLVPDACRSLDPIAALELLSSDDRWAMAPLTYGYVSYAHDGFRKKLIRFADIPALGAHGPVGSVIGGTGLAISAKCTHPKAAFDYAFLVASESIQKGLYASAGGQPAHRAAWLDKVVNEAAHGFYVDTLATLDQVWLRPRHEGYIAFQSEASTLIDAFLDGAASAHATAQALNNGYQRSWLPSSR
jgi:multiple sugar transport system substrate-binding protein